MDNIRGCLIGGAAGDALGYAVEFLSEGAIFKLYGERGITEYRLRDGLGRISDDTQMTLFTANGLLVGTTRGCMRGIQGPYPGYIAQAYQEWYKTQMQNFAHANRKFITCWLMNIPGLYDDCAPGTTCLTAIDNGCCGSIEEPINNSKGCGGVMRVAPIGLYFGERWRDQEDLQKLEEGNLDTQYIQKPKDILFPRLQDTPAYSGGNYYGLWGEKEALAYWNHPVLSEKLVEATEILLNTEKGIDEIGNCGC